MAGAKRGATEEIADTRASRRRDAQTAGTVVVTPRCALTGGKLGVRTARVAEGGGRLPGEGEGGARAKSAEEETVRVNVYGSVGLSWSRSFPGVAVREAPGVEGLLTPGDRLSLGRLRHF